MVLQLCGAQASCQVAQEFLQSLLGSISCHVLSLKYPGSARFLLGVEGQHLLQGLEAQFQCVFGTERLASANLDVDPEEVEIEFLPIPPLSYSPAPGNPSNFAQRLVTLTFFPHRQIPLRSSRSSLAAAIPGGPQTVQAVTRRT